LVCSPCLRIEKNNHPDVHCIQKEDSDFIKIEQIHQMHRDIYLRPFEGKYKVFIMLNAEDLTSEAANCLLKILEDPPSDSLIILIASDLRRILPTVISRCQKVMFNAKDPSQVETVLNCEHHLDKDLSHFLAFAFEGRLGQALQFKDHNILSEKNQIIRQFIINPQAPFNKSVSKDKEELEWILKILLTCVRDIYLLKIGIDKKKLINQDVSDKLIALAERFSFSDLDRILQQLSDTLQGFQQNINPRLLMDNLRLVWRK
jgi:DNA polymerase-3 subunit delta'